MSGMSASIDLLDLPDAVPSHQQDDQATVLGESKYALNSGMF